MKPGTLAEVVKAPQDPLGALVFVHQRLWINDVVGHLTPGELVTVIAQEELGAQIICKYGLCWVFKHRLESVPGVQAG